MSDRARIALHAALWLALGGWLGALLLFATAVAPAAFRVLPSSELAGTLVGAVLGPLQLSGAAAGVALALLGWRLGRGPALVLLPAALALLCLISHFGITPALQEIRDAALEGPGDPAARRRFAELHRLSLALLLIVGVGLIGLAVGHARADVRRRGATTVQNP